MKPQTRTPNGSTIDLKLEVIVIPVSDVDRAKAFYASALRRAESAHGAYEKQLGKRDENSPNWYAQYMVEEQFGK